MATKFALFGATAFAGAAFKSWSETREQVVQCKPKSVFETRFKPFVLGEVINLAEDVAVFRFLLQKPDDVFDLVPCSTLQACFKEGANIIDQPMRFYTPITRNGTKGYFDLVVRKQRPGRFTEYLYGMEVGDSLLFRVVQYRLNYTPNRWTHVGLIGGGTGICPLLQFMNAATEDPSDKTKLSLLFANRSENKILLKGMLDEMQRQLQGRLKVHYIVDRLEDASKEWKGYVGFITPKIIRDTMPPPSKDTLVLVCGPDGMMASICGSPAAVLKAMSSGQAYQPSGAGVLNNAMDVEGYLGDLGYTKDMVYRF